jgi:hypothetical protein
MEHVVFFSESSGAPAFRRAGNLEEAVRLVEGLRNELGITDVTLHALTPVPVSFRTYYRVEVGTGPQPEVVPEQLPTSDAAADETPTTQEPVPEASILEAPVSEAAVSEARVSVAPVGGVPVVAASPLALLPPPFEVAPKAPVEPADSDDVDAFDGVAGMAGESTYDDLVAAMAQVSNDAEVRVEGVDELGGMGGFTGMDDFSGSDFGLAGEVSEPAGAAEAVEPSDVTELPDVAETPDGFSSFESLVPLLRPEPEGERSLGYFAR